ncbi:MAG: FG-GAP-like repeat-containing protein [Gammaproteobacteria bacterium]
MRQVSTAYLVLALFVAVPMNVSAAPDDPAAPTLLDAFEPTDALRNRLGQGAAPEAIVEIDASAVPVTRAGGDVIPEFDERTGMHLDLAGVSPTDNSRRRLALGDFNNDNVEDVFIARWNQTARLFLNVGGVLTLQSGLFESPGDLENAHDVGIIDANDDGWLDVILRDRMLFNRGEDGDGTWLGFAAGVVMNGAETSPFTIKVADFDDDGDMDAVTSPGRRMLVNDGAGVLTGDTGRMGSNALRNTIKFQARDFDGDGDIDLAGPIETEDRHYVYLNDGAGSFPNANRQSLNLDTLTYVQVGADFNGDGISDYRVYADNQNPRAFLSTGAFNGIFPEYQRRIDPVIAGDQGKHGFSHIRDIDGDGDLDFVLSSIELFDNSTFLGNEKSNIVLNSGVNTGTFVSVFDAEWGDEEAFDVKLIDVNLDGNLDLLIAHVSRLAIYINGAPAQTVVLSNHVSPPSQINDVAAMSVEITGGTAPQFSWDFGDGSAPLQTSSPNADHVYTTPGRYQVTVNVTAGLFSDSLVFSHTAFAPRTANKPNRSANMAYLDTAGDTDADQVFVANPDHNSVSVLRIGDGALLAEIPVGETPTSLAFGGDGRLYVVNKRSATVSVIDPQAFTVVDTFSDFARGSNPHGIVFDPLALTPVGFVALEGSGEVARVGFDTGAVTLTAVGPTPRELAINADGGLVYVSRFITAPVPGESTRNLGTDGGGEVWVLDSTTLALTDTILIPYTDQPDDVLSARGIPNYLMAPVIAPSGSFAFVPASSSNIYRGQFRDGNNREHNMLVRSMLSRVDLGTNVDEAAARHDFDNSAQPTAGAFDPTGNYLYLVFENARVLRVYDIYLEESLASVDLDFAPNAVVVSPDGTRVIAHNWLGRSISVIDASAFADGSSNAHVLIDEFATVTSEVLADSILLGKQLFFDSADPRLTAQSYIACSTCHADGGHDGRTWDFSDVGEGLRNTADLRARAGVGHGNVHWTANFDEIHDFENDMRDIFKGDGLMTDPDFTATASTLGAPKAGLSDDLDALAAFVSTLASTGPSPYREQNGALSAAAQLGRQVFLNAGCATCHSGPAFTNSPEGGQFNDIGTVDADSGGRLGQPLPDGGLDTPTLLGLWSTAPYLHDGAAESVTDAVLAHTSAAVGVDVTTLSATQLDQLTAFLLQIESGTSIADADTDGIVDELDNCTQIANADQRDTNGDGYGNRCDADLNDDGTINVVDLGLLRAAFFGTGPDADFNGDGVVNVVDLGILRASFFGAPGPSGIAP